TREHRSPAPTAAARRRGPHSPPGPTHETRGDVMGRLEARMHRPTPGVVGTGGPGRTPTPLACVGLIALHDVIPVDVLHKRVDIGRRLRSIIDVIGMLIHVEGEERHPTREAARMI